MRKLLSVLALMAAMQAAIAQNTAVRGTVTDENGEPLPSAAVMTPDGKAGTVTDIDGRYSIQLPAGAAVLVYSFPSYASREVAVQGRSQIDVQLLPDESNTLNELVVIGYGTTKKSDLTGSVTNVRMQDVEMAPNTSIDQALQGRIAGVDIMSSSGEPGAATSIRIRGTRSIQASNEPLIIVDGVLDAINDISELNSSDIESISVMKDASSTAIYGSRGANGVILVTTKKGKTTKPSVTARIEGGFAQIARTLDTMNKDEFLRYINDYWYFKNGAQSAPRFDPADYPNDTDWLKEITRTAPYQNYSLSASGKVGDKLNYYAAIGYNDTRGIVDGSGFSRYNARLNLSYDAAKWLTVAVKLSYTYRNTDLNKANIGGTSYWDGAIYLSPIIGAQDTVNPLYENGTPINTPRANIDLIQKNRRQQTGTDVVEFTLKPVKGLTVKSQNSYMKYQRHDYQFWPSTLPKRVDGEGADAYRYEGDAMKFSTENTATYARKAAGGHSFDALLGFSASRTDCNYFSLKAEGLLNDELTWNNMAGVTSKENLTPYSYNEGVTKESFFARVNYNYKGRWYLTATGRFDGSSNFAANAKWGFFPSAAVKWVVSKEKFMRGVRWVDDLSLRFSAGRTGNDAIPYYRSLQAYSTYINSYLFDGVQGAAIIPDRVANPDLTWEKTTLYNAAIDASLLRNRLGVTLDLYYSYTTDLLLNVQTIQTTGYTSRLSNLGRTSNRGVELSLDGKIVERKLFGWTSQLTLSHNTQRVEDIGQESFVSVLNSPGNNSFMMYGYKKGYPLNSLWGFQYAGVWHSEAEFERNKYTMNYVSNTTTNDASTILGYPRYVDQNHDGVLSEEDLIYLGNSDPLLYGGWQNTFHIGPLSIGLFLSYSLGGKIYNYSELSMAGTYTANQYRYMLDAWHPLRNPESDIPRAGTEARMAPSSFYVHDASYLRLKNANISWRFDFGKSRRRFLRDLTVGVSGTNLLLLSRYNGFDPDVSTASDDATASTLRRVDMGAYPQNRMIIFSLQARY